MLQSRHEELDQPPHLGTVVQLISFKFSRRYAEIGGGLYAFNSMKLYLDDHHH